MLWRSRNVYGQQQKKSYTSAGMNIPKLPHCRDSFIEIHSDGCLQGRGPDTKSQTRTEDDDSDVDVFLSGLVLGGDGVTPGVAPQADGDVHNRCGVCGFNLNKQSRKFDFKKCFLGVLTFFTETKKRKRETFTDI